MTVVVHEAIRAPGHPRYVHPSRLAVLPLCGEPFAGLVMTSQREHVNCVDCVVARLDLDAVEAMGPTDHEVT